MSFLQIKIRFEEESLAEILVAELVAIGFDSFQEHEFAIDGYIEEANWKESDFKEVIGRYTALGKLEWDPPVPMQDQNWNELWESNFEPIVVDDSIHVYAPFHAERPDLEYKIKVMPKMAFGTGHHATTYMMLSQMRSLHIDGKSVFDFGCGTGILAVFAAQRGGAPIVAIDNDNWAVNNAKEVFHDNGVSNIDLFTADKPPATGQFDLILANINKNVLLNSVASLSQLLATEGELLISGILAKDQTEVQDVYKQYFQLKSCRERDGWLMMHWKYKGPDSKK